jgi:3-deoxy-D-arabino-heptulosonate 7-phosphate (DAHP) synthase
MTEFAPSTPTIEELHSSHPNSLDQQEAITSMRQRVSAMIGGHCLEGTLAVIGPCAMTLDEDIINHEGRQLAGITTENPEVLMLHRLPPWKPRTRNEDWHGLETTEPQAAYRILATRATDSANVTAEIGHTPHLERYEHLLALGWKGGRNQDNPQLTKALALHSPSLPIAIKNGLDGKVDNALFDVDAIQSLRTDHDSKSLLLFRGGANAQTPEAWREQYLLTHELTDGRMLVDWAHGGEQAHDPERRFGKSILGQAACMNHMLAIVRETGKAPLGIFTEATNADSPTDPVMPFEDALEGVRQLVELKRSL